MRIAQISDIQIRTFKRHKEYRQHFENLYASLTEKNPDAIILVGDIVHQKSNISPELVDICANFFRRLSEIAFLHIIPGNHDAVMNNLSRMDSLTPIINALNSSRIFYYKNSGVYNFITQLGLSAPDNQRLVVFSCLDDNWPTKEQIDQNNINIGLFHGMVQGALLQNGQIVEDSPYQIRQFLDMVDYLMLGDIHEHQLLDYKYRSAYCGSLIQQNYGESLKKGYLLWNIKSKKDHSVDFVELPNLCPYYTISLKDDLVVSDEKLQKKSRIRVISRKLTLFEKKSLTDKINSLYSPVDLIFDDDTPNASMKPDITVQGQKVKDLTDVLVQEKLIRDFLKPYNLSEESMQKILDVNKNYNIQARANDDVLRNIQYKLGKMSFSNTFSFGEDNVFDFSKHKGIVGVFGKNAVGKSSLIVDIPLYCVFNKISKKGVVKNDLIINENKEDCGVELEIEVGNDKYIVRRATHVYLKSGKKAGDPVYQGKTDVEFEIHRADGSVEIKNGEERSVTDKNIKEIFGTIEDFLATSMAPQWQLLGIIEAGGTERQKLIGRYFDIDIFEKKHKLAKENWKEAKAQLKLYEDRNFDEEIKLFEQQLSQLNNDITTLSKQKDVEIDKRKKLEDEILLLQSQVINNSHIALKEESSIIKQVNTLKNQILQTEQKRDIAIELKKKKDSFDIESIQKQLNLWEKCRALRESAYSLSNSCKCKHEEDCPIHINIQSYLKQANEISVGLDNESDLFNKRRAYENIDVIEKDLHSDKLIYQMKENLRNLESELEMVKREKDNSIKNKELFEKIKELKNKKSKMDLSISHTSDILFSYSSKAGSIKSSLSGCLKSKAQYDGIQRVYEVYDYFLMAMSKDGIVKRIIADNISIVNSEIKNILSDLDFSYEILSEEDGKSIEIYYVRNGKRRRIELCSGMEKTLCALVLRVALINITTLPKSNIMVLDEIFQSLDPEYKDIVFKMFDKLKKYFDCVYIVTHDEQLKDVADEIVEIVRNDEGYSRIS